MSLKEILNKIPIPPPKECGEKLDKYYRLKTFYYYLESSALSDNAENTLHEINNTLVKVEDCHSGEEALSMPGLKRTNRMYPILEDYIQREESGRIIALSRGNRIIIEPDGAYTILSRIDDEILLTRKH